MILSRIPNSITSLRISRSLISVHRKISENLILRKIRSTPRLSKKIKTLITKIHRVLNLTKREKERIKIRILSNNCLIKFVVGSLLVNSIILLILLVLKLIIFMIIRELPLKEFVALFSPYSPPLKLCSSVPMQLDCLSLLLISILCYLICLVPANKKLRKYWRI